MALGAIFSDKAKPFNQINKLFNSSTVFLEIT
jgi:hypothetical protein